MKVGLSSVVQRCSDAQRFCLLRLCSTAKSLIRGLINIDPSKRLTVKQALSHPWLQDKEMRGLVDRVIQQHSSTSAALSAFPPVNIHFPTNQQSSEPRTGQQLLAKSSTGTDSDSENGASTRGQKRKGEGDQGPAGRRTSPRTSPRKQQHEQPPPQQKQKPGVVKPQPASTGKKK